MPLIMLDHFMKRSTNMNELRKYLEDLDYLVYTEMDDIYAIK